MPGDFNLTVILNNLPKYKWFWKLVAGASLVLAFIVLVATDHLATALTILFLIISIAVFSKTLRILAHPYTSSEQKTGWAIGSFFCLALLIGFVFLMRNEWRTQTPQTPEPTSPAIEQTLPASSNQTSSNQTSP